MECLSDLGAGATPFRHKSPQANKEALCGFASLWRVEGDPPIVAELFDGLSDIGLNAWGVADGIGYDHILPGCRSVCVFGSGGTHLWESLLHDLKSHPHHLTEEDHPLDAFVARVLEEVDPQGPRGRCC